MASLRTYPPYIDMAVCRTGEKFTKYAAIAAAEAAIGPAIVSSIYRNRKSTRLNDREPNSYPKA
ncbi:UNVERIFIED_CONTAM: NAD(P)H-quinone oxidoreductase subunitL, chloroplastic [Sesamum angustifolium]|uniref:NAD(P)H-quinone oxidoreductase subunitL, chloroplastic n=1 Tax=Sesamum angustifolium TaxID=2727405 RepID=A0AAW2LTV0_9LAMI